MDEHTLLLPAADGMTAEERTAEMIEAMEAWSFDWPGEERNLVTLVDD